MITIVPSGDAVGRWFVAFITVPGGVVRVHTVFNVLAYCTLKLYRQCFQGTRSCGVVQETPKEPTSFADDWRKPDAF